MALKPIELHPGQIDVHADYPLGKARNVSSPGAGDGTPWEQDFVNDLFGFQQALLAAAGITPSEVPDTVTTSQYLAAIKALTRRTARSLTVGTAAPLAANDYWAFAADTASTDSGFEIGTDGTGPYVQVPEAGMYQVSVMLEITSPSVANPLKPVVALLGHEGITLLIKGIRHSNVAGDPVFLVASRVVMVNPPLKLRLRVIEVNVSTMTGSGNLSIAKVGGLYSAVGW